MMTFARLTAPLGSRFSSPLRGNRCAIDHLRPLGLRPLNMAQSFNRVGSPARRAWLS